MKRARWSMAVLAVTAALIGGTALAVTISNGKAATPLTVGQGTPVATQDLGPQDLQSLAAAGATDRIYLLGRSGDRSYYRIVDAGGNTCYAVGSGTNVVGLVGIACPHSTETMPSPLVDMSGIVLDPSNGSIVRLDRVEGIAADQVSAVGIERSDGSLVTTSVAGNVYRFAPAAIPSDAVAIVALDASGRAIERKTVR